MSSTFNKRIKILLLSLVVLIVVAGCSIVTNLLVVESPEVIDCGLYYNDNSYRLIQLESEDSSVKIYYTTDGSTPTTNSTEYYPYYYTNASGSSLYAIKVSGGSILKVIAAKNDAVSAVVTYSVPYHVDTPTITDRGLYSGNSSYRLIQISCSDSSASIYYTTNGYTPTTSSNVYSTGYYSNTSGSYYYSMLVPVETTLKAVAYYNGAYSDVYTYYVPSVIDTPTIIDRGQYNSDRSYRLITLSCSNSSATIYYTTNGSTPTTSSSRYSSGYYSNTSGSYYYSILVPAGSTLKAVAYYDGSYSDVYTYSVPSAISTPTITDRGQYSGNSSYRLVTISCSNSSATIYYTTNGSTPTTSSNRYSSGYYSNTSGSYYYSVLVSAGSTLKAVAYYNGSYSDVYTYSVPSAISTPTITDRGQYNSDRSYRLITLSCSNSSATIYYTTNGSTPTTSSNRYSYYVDSYTNVNGYSYYSVIVPAGSTLKAVAYYNGSYSDVEAYSVPSYVSSPSIVDRGQYSGNSSYRLVTISCSNSSANIYYTTNGSTPTTSSNRYSSGYYSNTSGSYYYSILVPVGSTLKAVAYYNGSYSDVASYTVSTPSISINTNGQWQSYSSGLSSSSYYSYQSYSNYHVHSSTATMYLTISGYDTFTLYIRSYAESSCDYTIAYEVDSSTSVKSNTSGYQYSDGTSLSSYKRVDYTGLGGTSHTIRIDYKKDYSIHDGYDRGYLVIPKNQ